MTALALPIPSHRSSRSAWFGALVLICGAGLLSGCNSDDSDGPSVCSDNALNAAQCRTESGRYVTPTPGRDIIGQPGSLTAPIPFGFYDGTARVTMSDPNLVPSRIAAGTTLFGVTGTAPSGACIDDVLNPVACVASESRYVTARLGTTLAGTPGALTVLIPAGYYAGDTVATVSDPALDASNIRKDVQLFGVTGELPVDEHPVGSCYGGGVVFYRSSDHNAPPGQRGLIAAPTDAQYLASFNIAWQQTGSTTISTRKTYFTGESNSNTILTTPGTFPAAIAANSYTTDGDTCPECTSWHLPSQQEMATLYTQSTSSIALGDTTFWSACNGTTPGITNFWSSTQNASNTAFSVSFTNGTVNSSVTSFSFRVRPVRAF